MRTFALGRKWKDLDFSKNVCRKRLPADKKDLLWTEGLPSRILRLALRHGQRTHMSCVHRGTRITHNSASREKWTSPHGTSCTYAIRRDLDNSRAGEDTGRSRISVVFDGTRHTRNNDKCTSGRGSRRRYKRIFIDRLRVYHIYHTCGGSGARSESRPYAT